jgi:spermidine/putrescine transport system substrate-binding protein
LVTRPITSWLQFFKPSEELQGRLGVLPSTRETTAMALKALGYSLNTRKGQAYRDAMALVEKQAPYVQSYGFPDLNESAKLVTGEVSAAMIYSGDALVLQEFNENIEYVLPKEGGNIWVDYLTVSSRSANKKAAWDFIEFINRPENAARQAEFVYYASPNKAATALMSEEFLSDTTINPSVAALKKSEFFQQMLPRRMKELDEAFEALIN